MDPCLYKPEIERKTCVTQAQMWKGVRWGEGEEGQRGACQAATPSSCDLLAPGHVLDAADDVTPGCILVVSWQEALTNT